MSEKIGPLALERREGPVFLGMQSSQSKEYSDSKAEEIDKEVYRLVTEGHEKAKQILRENVDVLHNLAKALLEHETIDGEEVNSLIEGMSLEEMSKRRGHLKEKMAAEQKEAAEKAEQQERLEKSKKEDPQGGRDPMGNPGPITA